MLANPSKVLIEGDGIEVFYVPSHWHAEHDEYHTVTKGKIEVTQTFNDGTRRVHVVGPEDGALFTPRGVVHSIRSFQGIPFLLEEVTQPSVSR